MKRNSFSRYALLGAMAMGAALSSGCARRTATFTVTRPAMVNAAAVGNTMQVAGIAAPTGLPQDIQAAAEIVSNLTQRISNSLNRSIRLVTQGGGITIGGMIVANQYSERIERSNRTCTRSVPYRSGNTTQYRTESYQCTDLRRIGQAVVRLQFTITRGADNAVIFDQTYEDAANVVTTGIRSPYESRDPNPIDGMGLLFNTRNTLVEHFAHVILPWNENVTVTFEDCDGDALCTQAYQQVQANNLAGAEALYTQLLTPFANPAQAVPGNMAEKVGEALYNRGLVRMYLGRYSTAVADITRAIALRPDESDWQQNLEEAQRMSRDQEALRQQGATSNETQNVQQAGTP
ncbi:MAG: tetratricopeptide repeat protein [Polyangiales bacterium]